MKFVVVAMGCLLTSCVGQADVPAQDVEQALNKIYGAYQSETMSAQADWDRAIFSARTTTAIDSWRRHLGDEPIDSLSEFGWLCECQDFEPKKFRVRRVAFRTLDAQNLEVTVEVAPGWGTHSRQRLILAREGNRWLVDDLFSESMPEGLRASLARALLAPPGE